jgi:predicted O-methyltransferase YrrM
MHLPWHDVPAGLASPLISTSLTAAESNRLAELAAGRDVVEVGSAYGYSACVMALAGARHVTAVDPHGWLNSHDAMVSNLDRCGVADVVTIVRAASPDALAGLAGPFGLVFIDGDHGSAAVMADVEAARKLLAAGGVLACHDLGEDCCCPGVRHALDALFPAGPSELVDTLAIYREVA